MRKIKITCKDRSLLQGFLLGVEWVNDSAIDITYSDGNVAVLEDEDGEGDEEYILTEGGFE